MKSKIRLNSFTGKSLFEVVMINTAGLGLGMFPERPGYQWKAIYL